MALPLRESMRQSELVFTARVEKVGASTLPELPASNATVVVAVDRVFKAPDVLQMLSGRSITIVTRDNASALRPGESALFLARGLMYGHSIAVLEVGRESDVDPQEMTRHAAEEGEAAHDDLIRARIAAADVVVTGKVMSVTPIQEVDPLTVSEHTPMWAVARIQVTVVEKGTPTVNEVDVAYPQSRDVVWYRAPKFSVGQEGVWILRRQPLRGLEREALTALDPLDFHPPDAVQRIRRLIGGSDTTNR
jgi:hypothetical protein